MTAEITDDPRLADEVAGLLGARHPVFAAARVTADGARTTTRGVDADATFELASVSKAFTGLAYADALDRGEVTAGTTLGALLPLDGAPAGAVTLASLSTHRSGLPRLPRAMRPLRRTIALWRRGTNPYGDDLATLMDHTRTVEVGRPRPVYSNLGFQLLGHAIAARAATTYAALLGDRLAAPLGLEQLTVPAVPGDVPPDALHGRSRRGAPREPWTGEALGPAGGVRASIRDVARLMTALLDGSAPGIAALDPVAPFGRGSRIGAGWLITDVRDRAITWHNGASGGFRSWIGLDRDAGTGLAVLSATCSGFDHHGFTLLAPTTSATA